MRTWRNGASRLAGAVVTLAFGILSFAPGAEAESSHPKLTQQSPVLVLDGQNTAALRLGISAPGSNSDATTVAITLYHALTTRAAFAGIVSNSGVGYSPLSSTGYFPLNCRGSHTATFDVGINRWRKSFQPCGSVQPTLAVPCSGTCNALFPLRVSVTSATSRSDLWSIVNVMSRSVTSRPLSLALIARSNPSTPATREAELASLDALSQRNVPSALSLSYRDVVGVATQKGSVASQWRRSVSTYLASARHSFVSTGLATTDYAGIESIGLLNDVTRQFTLTTDLLTQITGRVVNSPVVMTSGGVTPRSLNTLSQAGINKVILPETVLRGRPSSSLHWGTPFHVTHATTTLIAATTDEPLGQLANDTSIEPARRAAITVGMLLMLRAQAPNASVDRVAMMTLGLGSCGSSYINHLLSGIRSTPLLRLVSPTSAFVPSHIGGNRNPAIHRLNYYASSKWLPGDISTIRNLARDNINLATAYTSSVPLLSTEAARLEAETPLSERDSLVSAAQHAVAVVKARFNIDQSTITLAGGSSSIPITITSTSPYSISAIVAVSSDRFGFPQGTEYPIQISTHTASINIPASLKNGTSAFVTVTLKTPNGGTVISHATIQVRYAAASLVGYLLSFGSLGVIALWWYRNFSQRKKDRRA